MHSFLCWWYPGPLLLDTDKPVTVTVLRRAEHWERLDQRKMEQYSILSEGFTLRSHPSDRHFLDLGQTKAQKSSDGTRGITLCYRTDGWLTAMAWGKRPLWAQSQKHTQNMAKRGACSCSWSCWGYLSSGNLPHLWGHREGHLVGNTQQRNQCVFVLVKETTCCHRNGY